MQSQMQWGLRFHGVGNSAAVELGTAMASIECDGVPWLTIDCGSEGLSAFLAHYQHPPLALFITHTHLDHISGFERLFGISWFEHKAQQKIRLYVPYQLVPLLHQRVANYPNVLAEGGVNFWQAFELIPVGEQFWHHGQMLEVFAVRHHWPETAFGLRLPGALVFTGDTRPIADVLAHMANQNELIAHDCALFGNPSHSGIADLRREYPAALLARCVLYHHGSHEQAAALAAQGLQVALPNSYWPLSAPAALTLDWV